jgi:opine dehydrogenase
MTFKINTTVIGGSNSAHTLIPLLASSGHKVNLLTRHPEKWNKEITMEFTLPDGTIKDTLTGELNIISDKPEELIPISDIIILSLPVSKYRTVLDHIAPYIDKDKKIYLGTIYGQGGFNWMVEEIKKKYRLTNIVTFASGLIPWITRTKEYGKNGINYGPKEVNVVAVAPKNEYSNLESLLLDDLCFNYFKTGKFKLSENFISLTLSVDNQIIHQTRLFGLYKASGGNWQNFDDIPLFYKDYDDLSANFLKELDEEYTLIRNYIKDLFPDKDFSYMLNYLDLEQLSYHSSNTNIKESFTKSKTLGQIPTPVVKNEENKWVINSNHRFFDDDIYYGICIAKWFAQKFDVSTPMIDSLLEWAQFMLNDKIIQNGHLIKITGNRSNFKYGTPDVYGFNDINQIID